MFILNISAIKSIKISVTTTAKITDRNAGMSNVLNCQTTSIRKMSANYANFFHIFVNCRTTSIRQMSAKLCKLFPHFCKLPNNKYKANECKTMQTFSTFL